IQAVYSGAQNFAGSQGTGSQVVNRANTTTVLVSSLNPSLVGTQVTFTATVSAVAPGSGIPDGTVTFNDGDVFLGSSPLNLGSASLQISTLPVGSHNMTATYNGSLSYNPSGEGLSHMDDPLGTGRRGTAVGGQRW